jgi:Domain of unknown function (DUF4440)
MSDNGEKIIELDRQRMAAFARMDVARAKALLSDDLIFTHVSPLVDTKESLIRKMESGEIVYSLQEPSDVKAQDYGNVVVLTGSTNQRHREPDQSRWPEIFRFKPGDSQHTHCFVHRMRCARTHALLATVPQSSAAVACR